MRSNRQHWFLRHKITGELKRSYGPDSEDGIWGLWLAGGRNGMADYDEEWSTLTKKAKKPLKGKKVKKAAS